MGATGVYWIGARFPLFFYFGLGLGGLIYIYSVFSCTCTFLSFFPVFFTVGLWFRGFFFFFFSLLSNGWIWICGFSGWVIIPPLPVSFFTSFFQFFPGTEGENSVRFGSVLFRSDILDRPALCQNHILSSLHSLHILSILSTFSPHTITALYLSAR